MHSPRVVTTLPAVTEIVCALGLEPVGVSHSCDYPPVVESIPTVTDSPIDTDASSEEIDRQVREHGESLYSLDAELLESLEPDLITTQATCEVCAVDEAVVQDTLASCTIDPAVQSVDPHTVGEVLTTIESIGAAIGREDRAATLVEDLEDRIDSVRSSVPDTESPRLAVLDWTDPIMVAGHWVPDLVEWAGGQYPLADPGDASTPRAWSEITAAEPEVLVIAPCGFTLEQMAENVADLRRDGWNDLPAVQHDRVWVMDGSSYLNRPGPRLVDSLEHLAGICHPDDFERPPRDVARLLPELVPRP